MWFFSEWRTVLSCHRAEMKEQLPPPVKSEDTSLKLGNYFLGTSILYHLLLLKPLLVGDEQYQATWWLGENWKSQQCRKLCCCGRWREELAVWVVHSRVYRLITVFSGWELEELINIFNQSIPQQDHNYFLWPISFALLLLRQQHLSFSSTHDLYIHIRRLGGFLKTGT